MGTRGYIVHRYKRRWLVVYNHWNSYPGCLGVSVLLDIPTDPDEFQAWLIDARGMVETRAKEWEAMTDEEREHCFDDFIALEQPVNDLSIEWVYEMDLDNLHIDGCPLFCLDHMPSEDIFLKSISIDNNGDRACAFDTPDEYRYNWQDSPPSVDDTILATYEHYHPAIVSIHELLSVRQELSNRDAVRVRFLEACIGTVITQRGTRLLRQMESIPDHNSIPDEIAELAVTLVLISLSTLPYSESSPAVDMPEAEFWWPKSDVCVQLRTHLDHEDSMQAAVTELVGHVLGNTDTKGTVHRVAFFMFHCVVVRVDRGAELSVRYTPALQFVPSYYASSPSTPGTVALALLSLNTKFSAQDLKLEYLRNKDLTAQVDSFQLSPPSNLVPRFPFEILQHTAEYVTTRTT